MAAGGPSAAEQVPAALRPRQGWASSTHNPEAVHGLVDYKGTISARHTLKPAVPLAEAVPPPAGGRCGWDSRFGQGPGPEPTRRPQGPRHEGPMPASAPDRATGANAIVDGAGPGTAAPVPVASPAAVSAREQLRNSPYFTYGKPLDGSSPRGAQPPKASLSSSYVGRAYSPEAGTACRSNGGEAAAELPAAGQRGTRQRGTRDQQPQQAQKDVDGARSMHVTLLPCRGTALSHTCSAELAVRMRVLRPGVAGQVLEGWGLGWGAGGSDT